jgi:hypothetical protein
MTFLLQLAALMDGAARIAAESRDDTVLFSGTLCRSLAERARAAREEYEAKRRASEAKPGRSKWQ